MIIRVSEAQVKAERVDDFVHRLRALVGDFPSRYQGLHSHEICVDIADPTRVQYVSRWIDEVSLIAYAGADWAMSPVTFPDEETYLEVPLTLRHFTTTTPPDFPATHFAAPDGGSGATSRSKK